MIAKFHLQDTVKKTAVYWGSEVYPSIRQSLKNKKSMSENFLLETSNIETDLVERIASKSAEDYIKEETRKHCEECSEEHGSRARRCVREASVSTAQLFDLFQFSIPHISLIFSTEGSEESQRLFDIQRRVEEDGGHS